MRRKFFLPVLFLSLLLFGCGGSSTDQAVDTTPVLTPISGPQKLVLTTDNAVQVARTADELLVPSGRNSVELAGGNLSLLEIDGVAAALVELPLAYPILAQDVSGQFPGPGGGSARLTVNGRAVTVEFNSFTSEDGSVLNGTAFMTGDVQGLTGEIQVAFAALQITDPDGFFQIDGPVTLSLERVNEPDRYLELVQRTLNVTVTDLGRGGTVRMLEVHSESDINVEGGVQSGISTVSGTLLFDGFESLTGQVELVPDVPYTFNVDHATLISSVTSGQSFYEGEGTVRRRILGTNVFETSVRPAGATDFIVVATTDISDIDQ